MTAGMATEKRMLTASEFEMVARSHYPALNGLSRDETIALTRQIREYHAKASDITRTRRRERRGKAEPRGVNAAPDESGVAAKKQVFAAALKRLNKRIDRLEG